MEKKGVFALFVILILFSIFAFANPYGNNILDSKKVPSSMGYHELRLIVNGSDLYSIDANENGIIDVAESVLGGGAYWLPAVLGIYYMGNAGIGEDDPQRKLHISASQDANIRLQDTSYADNGTAAYIEFYNETDRIGAIGIPGGNSSDYLVIATEKGKDIALMPYDGGKVGIGTTSPTAKLEIIASEMYEGSNYLWNNLKLTAEHNPTILFHHVADDKSTAISSTGGHFRFYTGANGNMILEGDVAEMVINDNGNVGIGTTSPAATLHIYKGNGLYLEAETSSGTQLNFITLGDGTKGLNNAATKGWHIYARENTYSSIPDQENDFGLAFFDGLAAITIMHIDSVTGNVGIGTRIPAGTLDVNGNICIKGSCIGNWSSMGGSSLWLQNGTDIYYNNGNIGIGTNSPQKPLHISATQDANIRLQDTDASNRNSSYVEFYAGSKRIGGVGVPGDSKDYLGIITEDGKDIILSPSGNVGIGTISPGAKLDVAGVINGRNYAIPSSAGTPQWAKIGTFKAGQAGHTIKIVAYIHNGYNAINSQDSVYNIMFKTSNGATVDSNGFAGNGYWYAIGNNNAIAPGHIKWVANAAGVSATSYDLYIYLPSHTYNSHYDISVVDSASWTNIGSVGQSDPGAASSTVLIPSNNFNIPYGNVGIGTTSPGAKLHIKKGASGQGTIDVNSNAFVIEDIVSQGLSILTPATSAGQISFGSPIDNRRGRIIYSHNDDTMKFVTGGAGNYRMTIAGSGNVGIGTTNPTSRFQIGTDTVLQQWSGSAPYVLIQGVDNEVATPALQIKDENQIEMFTVSTYADGGATGGRAYFGGNVGIGTTAPSSKLHVKTTDTTTVPFKVEAMTDLISGWPYRRATSLSPVPPEANYQVLVTLTTAIMGNPYTNVKSDGSDIRFTASDGNTPLNYWIESWSSTGTSKIWVKVKDAGASTIYMYYGNSAASPKSSASNTFDPISWTSGWRNYQSTSCTGPTNWERLVYDDSPWGTVSDITVNWWGGCDSCDMYIRKKFFVTSVGASKVNVRSDDGQWFYVGDGSFLGNVLGGCHAGGSGTYDWTITNYLRLGDNVMAVHCSEGGGEERCELTSWNVPNSYLRKYSTPVPSVSVGSQQDISGGVNTAVLFVEEGTGNVGIGTSAPTQKLDVEGGLAINGDIYHGLLKDWRLIYKNNFNSGSEGWNKGTYTCGDVKMLGGYGVMAGGCMEKIYDLSAYPHSEVRVVAEYWHGDSWDNEAGYAELDDYGAWYKTYPVFGTNHCGDGNYGDTNELIDLRKQHTGNSLKVELCSTLNEGNTNEWFGADNVEVWVR